MLLRLIDVVFGKIVVEGIFMGFVGMCKVMCGIFLVGNVVFWLFFDLVFVMIIVCVFVSMIGLVGLGLICFVGYLIGIFGIFLFGGNWVGVFLVFLLDGVVLV